MQRIERQYLQKQQIQGPLDKIGWLAHSRLHSVTENNTTTPLGKQEECSKECLKVSAWAASAMERSRGASCLRWRANRAPPGRNAGALPSMDVRWGFRRPTPQGPPRPVNVR